MINTQTTPWPPWPTSPVPTARPVGDDGGEIVVATLRNVLLGAPWWVGASGRGRTVPGPDVMQG